MRIQLWKSELVGGWDKENRQKHYIQKKPTQNQLPEKDQGKHGLKRAEKKPKEEKK